MTTDPPQLTDVDALAQLSFLIVGLLETRIAAYDLSLVQTRLLGILRDREPTMRELARLLGLDKSSVSGLVDRAARRGFVERVPSTVDRRAVTVRLTAPGRERVTAIADEFAVDIEERLERLTAAQRRDLVGAAAALLAADG